MSTYGITSYYNGGIQSGNGIMDWLQKANQFAKDKQLVSNGANLLGNLGVNIDPRMQMLLDLAKKKGYGNKRAVRGKGKKRTTKRKK